jgi:hypothetical protein
MKHRQYIPLDGFKVYAPGEPYYPIPFGEEHKHFDGYKLITTWADWPEMQGQKYTWYEMKALHDACRFMGEHIRASAIVASVARPLIENNVPVRFDWEDQDRWFNADRRARWYNFRLTHNETGKTRLFSIASDLFTDSECFHILNEVLLTGYHMPFDRAIAYQLVRSRCET